MQLKILHPLSLRSWSGMVDLDPYLPLGTRAVLVAPNPMALRVGTKIRVIDARVQTADEDELVRVHLTSTSEVYVLPESSS
jgi:hypothetical protein